MAYIQQSTLKRPVRFEGVGLHSGETCALAIEPAQPDTGLVFRGQSAAGPTRMPALVEHVVDTRLATTLGTGLNGHRFQVGTVEHLLSALSGLGVDNALIDVEGPEVPVMDGSAADFVALFTDTGIVEQDAARIYMVITEEVSVGDLDRHITLSPAKAFSIRCQIDHNHPLICSKPFEYTHSAEAFTQELAFARTFGLLKDVEWMRDNGLAKGGSLHNALVIDEHAVVNPDGFRVSNECVRHKTLDAIGDLALCGHPIRGHLDMLRPGHCLNVELVRKLLATPTAYELTPMAEAIGKASSLRVDLSLPA
jgi:UDP-3-O-[3-hydroxymyristoyl] N-acetylglucosamine deacetylase